MMCERGETNINISETQKAYIAGLFDGEGTVRVEKSVATHSSGNKGFRYRLGVSIASTDKIVIDFVQSFYGGNTRFRKGTGNQRDWYEYYLYNEHARVFLSGLLQYFIIKKDRAELGIEFREFQNLHKGSRLSDVNPAKEALYLQMKELNRRGVS